MEKLSATRIGRFIDKQEKVEIFCHLGDDRRREGLERDREVDGPASLRRHAQVGQRQVRFLQKNGVKKICKGSKGFFWWQVTRGKGVVGSIPDDSNVPSIRIPLNG